MQVKPLAEFNTIVFDLVQQTSNSQPTLLLLSGGSVLDMVPPLLSQLSKIQFINRLTISLIDERWSEDPSALITNWNRLIQLPVYSDLLDCGVECRSVLQAGLTAELVARNHEKLLDSFNGPIISLFGIGSDGHTAGVLPQFADKYPELLENKVIAYKTDDPQIPIRITPGIARIKSLAMNKGFAIVTGESKRPILSQLLRVDQQTDVNQFPAAIFNLIPNFTIFSDIKL